MSRVASEFDPNITHPLYFMRKGLFNEVKKHSGELTGKLLDFGCGTKPYKACFKVDEYIGIDYENEGHPHDAEPIDYFYDGEHLPFKDAEFDSVFSSEAVEHVFNLPHILCEIHRVMKPGGKLLITCPFVWNEHETPNDYARYTLYALRDLLQNCGYTVVTEVRSGNFIEVLTQLNILCFTPFFYKVPFLWRIFVPVYCTIVNLLGLFFAFILPTRKDLYLSNVVMAVKN